MSIPKNGMMICNNPKCKDVETKLKDEFALVVVIEALEERDYSVIEKLRDQQQMLTSAQNVGLVRQ